MSEFVDFNDLAMPFQVRVSSRFEMGAMAAEFSPTHVVSIVVRNPVKVDGVPPESVLHLKMDDIAVPSRALSPSLRHVGALLRFADSLKPDDRVLFHCEAGISRSSASAWICLVRGAGLHRAADAARYVKSVRSMADPNRLLVRLAARAMKDRTGQMNAALPLFDGWRVAFDEEDSFGLLPPAGCSCN